MNAFLALIQPYERAIYLVGLAFAASRDLAEEIAFQAIFRAYAAREEIEGVASLPAWLIRFTVSAAQDLVRFDCCVSVANSGELSAEVVECLPLRSKGRDVQERLTRAFFALPQRERAVILLRDTLHLASAEIAQILDLPIRSVKDSLSCARFGILERLAISASCAGSAANNLASLTGHISS